LLIEHELSVDKKQWQYNKVYSKTLTVACLKHKTILNIKNLEKSTKLSEFLKLCSELKFTTSLGKKFQMLTTLVLKKYLR